MDIKGLQYFITAAERLNFTSAARECYITQTAMSLHISKMEDELGFKLFTRNKKTVELTEAGYDFYKRACAIIEHYARSVRCSASIAEGIEGILNVVLPSCMEGFLFMEKLRAFCEKYPATELNVLVEPHNEIINTIKSGRADVGIGAPEDMELDPDFCVVGIREDPAALICGKRHRLAKYEKVAAEMLREETIILSIPRGQTYPTMGSSVMGRGFEKNRVLPVRNMDEMLLMAALERGVGFLPGFAIAGGYPDTAGIAVIEYENDGAIPMMTTAVGYLKENQNPVLKNFLCVLLG